MIEPLYTLDIPHYPQVGADACGAACLQMIYSFYGQIDVQQKDIIEQYSVHDPHFKGFEIITTDSLVRDARRRGYNCGWAQANYDNVQDCRNLLDIMIRRQKIPLIVCQQLSRNEPLAGHFRVITGISDTQIRFHDPDENTGGPSITWPLERFVSLWRPTGENVTGGVFVFVTPPR